MNRFVLLLKDELKGFWKSNIMIILWVGLPALSIVMHFIQPDTEGFPISLLIGLLIASVGGTLSSVMLSTSIVSERNRKVYDLFVIRDQNIRTSLILAKFTAVYVCLVIATGLSIFFGLVIDYYTNELPTEIIWENTVDSLGISIAAMAIACSVGILLGLLVDSVPAAAILSIYVGNQLSLIAVLPGILVEDIDPLTFAGVIGIILTVVVMAINIFIFNRKQL
jgi:ABC-2 type transport system permease protein